jgi:hypothetical protein
MQWLKQAWEFSIWKFRRKQVRGMYTAKPDWYYNTLCYKPLTHADTDQVSKKLSSLKSIHSVQSKTIPVQS